MPKAADPELGYLLNMPILGFRLLMASPKDVTWTGC